MIVGLPGSGLSALFYLALVLLMPVRLAWRAWRDMRVEPHHLRTVARQFFLAGAIVASFVVIGLALEQVMPSPSLAGPLATDGERLGAAFAGGAAKIGLQLTAATLIAVLAGVQLLSMAVGRLNRPRALITGGAGFIGGHIVRRLRERGYEVYAIDDLSTGSASNVSGAQLIELDITDASTARVVEQIRPDVVVHAAAQTSVPASHADPARDRAVNYDGTLNVLRGAQLAGTRRFVFLSSGGAIYGETTLATETDEPRPVSPYGLNKLAAEHEIAASGIPYANLRLANVYGPGQRAGLEGGVVAIFAERLHRDRRVIIYGSGEQTRDLVHVDDVVGAVVHAIDTPQSGTWNVGTGRDTSIKRLLRLMEKLTDTSAEVSFAPSRPGDVPRSSLSPARTRRSLGWSPSVPLEAGLQTVLAGRS